MARRKRGLRSHIYFYKRDARARGIAWRLSEKRAMRLMSRPCHWCHAAPSPYNGIDRLNNEPYYAASNAVPACKRCNRAKCTMTAMEFVRWCAVVVMNRMSAVRDGQHLLTM